jgi:YD repeat-containing protein
MHDDKEKEFRSLLRKRKNRIEQRMGRGGKIARLDIRVLTRTDPLLRNQSYSYDLAGNLVSSTDRKSQVTSLTYDSLNRLKLIGYKTVVNAGVTSYESTVSYTYDAGGRMTQVVDSASGTITKAYDNFDRLITETTAQGSISYGYDLGGRRTSMTVAGQPQVNYSYDNADRLTQIAQGASTVGFTYDNANRRSALTLSNGVSMAYTYDNNSRVIGITYNFGATTLGNLAYSYDSLGRRTLVSLAPVCPMRSPWPVMMQQTN